MSEMERCFACGAEARQEDHMLAVVCTGCGRHTPNMQGTLGEFQREWWAARDYWNKANQQARDAAAHGERYE